MRLFYAAILLPLLLITVCPAQDRPARVVGVNIGFCQTCDTQVNGGVFYSNAIANGEHPTHSFSLVNIDKVTVNSWRPVNAQVMTSAETGIAQQVVKFNRFDVFGLATAGVATDSTNTGGSYGGGTLALMPLGKGLLGGVYVRVNKATIAQGVGWKVGFSLALGSK